MSKSLVFALVLCFLPLKFAFSEEIPPYESCPLSAGFDEEARERRPERARLNNTECESIEDYFTCTLTSNCYWSGSCHGYY